MERRLLGADFVRAAACLTVLFHHLAQRMSYTADLGPFELFRLFARIGTYGVGMFFVLSGFLLARPFWAALDAGRPMPPLRVYAARRAARVLPGYWLTLTVAFVLSFAVFGSTLDGELVLRYAAGFLLVADWHWLTLFPVDVDNPLWSISFEVTSYALLPLGLAALFVLRRYVGGGWAARVLWIAVIAVVLIVHALIVRFVPIDTARAGEEGLIGVAVGWVPRFNPFSFFAMFAIGALGAGIQVRVARHRHIVFDAVAVAALFVTIWCFLQVIRAADSNGYGWLDIPYGFPWFVLAIAALLAAGPSTKVLGPMLDARPIRYIAQISFGIYVWHYIVLELVRVFVAPDMDHGVMADPLRFAMVSALVAGVTVLIAHLSFRFIENPVIQWERKRERPGDQVPPAFSRAA